MPRRCAPVWLMGLANSVFGMYGGIVAIAMPQILSARHVGESTIAGVTAVAISPGFWTFIVSPILDVRFSRRSYALLTAMIGAALLLLTLVNLDHLVRLEALLTGGFFCACLNQSAYGGWLSSITAPTQKASLSMWVTVGNVGGTGVMGLVAAMLVQLLSPPVAAVLLAALLLLPTAVFAWMPAPGPDRRLAGESFVQFFGEIAGLLRRREVVFALLLFAVPAGTFSLTNFLSGLGDDFHASVRFVSIVAGAGVTLGAIAGCFVFPLVRRLLPLRLLYLAVGIIGALFTLAMISVPRTPETFAVALVGENVFQGLAITLTTAIAFDIIGEGNALASTTYSFVASAYCIPITYMLLVDGWGYVKGGVAGSFLADAGAGLIASAAMVAVLLVGSPRRTAVGAANAATVDEQA